MPHILKNLFLILFTSTAIFASADFNEAHFSDGNFRMFLESMEEQQTASIMVNDSDVYNPSDSEDENQNSFIKPSVSGQGPILIGAINGGGVKGIVSAKCLSQLVSLFDRHVTDIFDMLAGTSTGSIIAGGLTAVDDHQENIMTPRMTKALYKKQAATIFNRTWGETLFNPFGLRGPLYQSHRLDGILQEHLYDIPFNQTKIPTVVTAYNMTKGKGKVFCSHQLEGNAVVPNRQHDSLIMRDVIGASCAAPGFFAAKKLNDDDYVDGCLFALNPAEVAYNKAKKLFPNRDIYVISFGTGYSHYTPKALTSWGTLEWTKYFAMQMLKSQDTSVDDRLQRQLNKPGQQKQYYKIDFEINPDCRFDDGSINNMQYLSDIAKSTTQSQDFFDVVTLIKNIKNLKVEAKRV